MEAGAGRSGGFRAGDAALPLVLAWAVHRTPERVHHALVTEDGVLEWLQVVALGVCIVVLGRRALARRSPAAFVGAATALFVAGEEIAWGTRLLDLDVPLVSGANEQNEVTLHNLENGLTASFVAVALAGLVAALWYARRRPTLAVWFAAPAAYAAARVAIAGPIGYRVAKLSEVFELVLYAAVARASLSAADLPDAVTIAERPPTLSEGLPSGSL